MPDYLEAALRAAGMDPDRLAHHLRVAAVQYDADADLMDGTQGGGDRIAAEFRAQAKEARTWADALEF